MIVFACFLFHSAIPLCEWKREGRGTEKNKPRERRAGMEGRGGMGGRGGGAGASHNCRYRFVVAVLLSLFLTTKSKRILSAMGRIRKT